MKPGTMAPESISGLEAWRRAELPAPPVARGVGLLGVIGPGTIILGVSIGSGEWLLGPAAFVKHGLALLWVTLVAAIFQTILNTELMRYTLYTGEPALTGFMRTRPRAGFWAGVYALLFFVQVGWPGWAGTAAGAVFFLGTGRLATPADAGAVYVIGAASLLLCVVVLLFGGRIERTLEILNWVLVVGILGGLLVLCALMAPAEGWWGALAGFFAYDTRTQSFSLFPVAADWALLGALAAYSGAGGVINLMLSNWARDKGFGMAQLAGYIPTAIGGGQVKLAHTGTVFEPCAENLRRWRAWWRVIVLDQWGVFFCGALLGMALPAILYTSFIAAGTDIRGLAVASELAGAMAEQRGAWLATAVAVVSVWVLLKTQLDILDGLVRAVTDILWTGSRTLREWRGGDVRWVYYPLLGLAAAWGLVALRLTQPMQLLVLGANIGGVAGVISALHILRVNTTLLPRELRPPMWRRVALVAMAVFYGFFVVLWLNSLWPAATW